MAERTNEELKYARITSITALVIAIPAAIYLTAITYPEDELLAFTAYVIVILLPYTIWSFSSKGKWSP